MLTVPKKKPHIIIPEQFARLDRHSGVQICGISVGVTRYSMRLPPGTGCFGKSKLTGGSYSR